MHTKHTNTHIYRMILQFTYVFGMLRIARCRKKITISVPLPTTPTTNIKKNKNGIMYVSGRSAYGLYRSQSGSSSVHSLGCWPDIDDGMKLTLLAIIDGKPIFLLLWLVTNLDYYLFLRLWLTPQFVDKRRRKKIFAQCMDAFVLISAIFRSWTGFSWISFMLNC